MSRLGMGWLDKARILPLPRRIGLVVDLCGLALPGRAWRGMAGLGNARQDKVHHRLLDTAGDGFIRRLRARRGGAS